MNMNWKLLVFFIGMLFVTTYAGTYLSNMASNAGVPDLPLIGWVPVIGGAILYLVWTKAKNKVQ